MILCIIVVSSVYAERKVFTFNADNTFANLAEGKEYTVLRGNALVTADDVQITAGEIKLYGDDFQFAEVNEVFTAVDLANDFTLAGERLFYDRTQKLLRAEGNIIMKDRKNDVIIRAHFLESRNDGDFMIVQLGVRITKNTELSARTEFLTYYRKTEELEMTGFPYALWKEDEYRADRISINLDTDEVSLEGKVQGFISTVKEEATEPTDTGDETINESATTSDTTDTTTIETTSDPTGITEPTDTTSNQTEITGDPIAESQEETN